MGFAGGVLGVAGFLGFGGVYVRFRFCFGWFAWRWHCGAAFVLRLDMGASRAAWWGGVVPGSGLRVRAVLLVWPGFGFRAGRFGFGLAVLGAAWFRRFAGVRGLWVGGSIFRGQGGFAFRAFLPCGLRRVAAGSGVVFLGCAWCLVCLVWWRWPVRGRCPRPAPP